MTRYVLVLSAAVLGTWQGLALADCPSGYAHEILCDSFDTYCVGGGYPGSPDCASGPGDNALLRTVWKRTSADEATGSLCGYDMTVDLDPMYINSLPFAGRRPAFDNVDSLSQISVSNWNVVPSTPGIGFLIENTFPGHDQVAGTDAHPLILEFYMSGVNKPESTQGGNLRRCPGYVELALGGDRANTDYVNGPNCATYCSPAIKQGPFPIVCAVGNPENNFPLPATCPPVATAPLHNAIAIGTMSMMDPDPCHCGVTDHGSLNWHLAFFDGRLWWSLRTNEPMPSTGSIEPESGAPMPPAGQPGENYDIPGDFTFAAGRDGGYGPPNNWVTVTIKTNTIDVKLVGRNLSPPDSSYIYRITHEMKGIPRQYTGPFDQLRIGCGAGCRLSGSSSWTNCAAPRTCLVTQRNNTRSHIFDDVVLHGGIGFSTNGACCLDSGACADDVSETYCETEPPAGLGGIFQGLATTCESVTCCPYPFADADGDGDVDHDDFGLFQVCYTGSASGVPEGCSCFDRSSDNKINVDDFLPFSRCYTGANVPWSAALTPNCVP